MLSKRKGRNGKEMLALSEKKRPGHGNPMMNKPLNSPSKTSFVYSANKLPEPRISLPPGPFGYEATQRTVNTPPGCLDNLHPWE